MRTYTDKNGRQIKAGDTVRTDTGEIEQVYLTEDSEGNDNLGIMATNKDFLKCHPDWEIEYYSLSMFPYWEWEVVI